MGVTGAIFRLSGNTVVVKHLLKMSAKGLASEYLACLMTEELRPSDPRAFPE